jgi:hypothetical protein
MDSAALRDLVAGSDPSAAWGDCPLLIVKAPGADVDAPTLFSTPTDADSTVTDTTKMRVDEDPGATGYVAPGAVVIPLRKSKRNPFIDMITVGRAHTNDVIIDDSHVSKVHAWFSKPKSSRDQWLLRDHNATNGTFVNRVRLSPDVPRPIQPSDEIRFGTVDTIYIEAGMLQALIDYARATWTRLGIIKPGPSPDDTATLERKPDLDDPTEENRTPR